MYRSHGSYLDVPRIHFTGKFRADVNTRNNDNNTFSGQLNPDQNKDWNFNGTNEFSFFDTSIVAVDLSSSDSADPEDPVLSAIIFNNADRVLPKIVDLDVDCQEVSTIYGMEFGIGWNEGGVYKKGLTGKWTPSVIAQDMWPRLKCFTEEFYGDRPQDSVPFGSQGTTILTDIEWGDTRNSPALQELRVRSTRGSGKLSIRVSYYFYPRNYGALVPYAFALGYVVGTIGVYDNGETLNFGGDRMLIPDQLPQLTFDQSDSCYEENPEDYTPWTSKAPFELHTNEVVVDLSNAIPIDIDLNQRNIGELYLAYEEPDANCIYIIQPDKPIPYLRTNWLKAGAIATYSLTDSEHEVLVSHSLLVIQKVKGNAGDKICGQLPSTISESAIVVLREREYFIRPLNYYVDRLEYGGEPSLQTLLVTKFGAPVSIDVQVSLSKEVIPEHGVQPTVYRATSDSNGHVQFTFEVVRKIPYPRLYGNDEKKRIEGQVYTFGYCVIQPGQSDCTSDDDTSRISFLAFSTINPSKPYTWVKDVEPIFSQYAHLTPAMKDILDLSNYTDVTLPWNIGLLKHSMSVGFDDPNYMPVTRDLAPKKREMILEWLNSETPLYDDSKSSSPPSRSETSCQSGLNTFTAAKSSLNTQIERCNPEMVPYSSHIKDFDPYFSNIFKADPQIKASNAKIHLRPLIGITRSKKKTDEVCTLEDLHEQLLGAMQLEFYTIPVYLTSLYSIVDGCNHEIYTAIREVVMQEMMHFAQAANILIAVGGDPDIDNANFAPTYPQLGLPGGVLPSLYVTLEKLSLKQVYEVFMGIEVPAMTNVGGDDPIEGENTIGEYYEEIKTCINYLPDSIFDSGSISRQVAWPWKGDYVGHLRRIRNKEMAINAIDKITEQGEGATATNPNHNVPDQYAHFFRFEEILCQKRLVSSGTGYTYSGAPIPFNAAGVWNMRDNPDSASIRPNTNCYTEAKTFHTIYRSFLRKLDEAFSCQSSDCHPQSLLLQSVELMEDLQIHAKKLMWIKFNPHNPYDPRTCGPVWDYDWNGPNSYK